jgi:hypothetical protein
MTSILTLEGWTRRPAEIAFAYRLGDLRLVRKYRYEDVDLDALEARHGAEALDRLLFHLVALEAIPLVGLAPEAVDFGPGSRFLTPRFEPLWRTLERNVGAQWRYENNRPAYRPEILSPPRPSSAFLPVFLPRGAEALAFCGGGKDSLAAAKLLERAGLGYASLAFAYPDYGCAGVQHRRIDSLLDACRPRRRHRVWVSDDADRGEVFRAAGAEPICAETPISLFAALPIVLQHGYRYLVLGNEHSADAANFLWEETGEEVNHQWGKSLAAELLLAAYLREELLPEAAWFSILKPLCDPAIFGLLREHAAAVGRTHSCNVRKPWCERCPKCVYVWLSLMAYLPRDAVEPMFTGNLLDVPENVVWLRRLLGLGPHKPFECVGEPGETRLAFEICRRKGVGGEALASLAAELPPIATGALLDRYLQVHDDQPSMPPDVRARVLPLLHAAAGETRRYLEAVLAGAPL